MVVWEQEARQGRGRHLQQLHHLQHRAGLSQHQPQSGEAHPGDAASRVTFHMSNVTCHVSGHPPSRGPDRAAGAEPRRAQVCARRDAGAVRHGPARPHQHTVTKYFSCVYINILFLFQDTWIWCAEASVSCLHCVTRRYRWQGRENIDLTNIIIILTFFQQIASRILINIILCQALTADEVNPIEVEVI